MNSNEINIIRDIIPISGSYPLLVLELLVTSIHKKNMTRVFDTASNNTLLSILISILEYLA